MGVTIEFGSICRETINNRSIRCVLLAFTAIPMAVVVVKMFVTAKMRRVQRRQRKEYAYQKMLAIEKLAHCCKLKVRLLRTETIPH